jgi:glycosyltransferase involved in cell wall biosynthesis
VLPQIFNIVKENYNGEIAFWILGDGKLRTTIEREFSKLHIVCDFLGNVPVDKMADYLNCVDVLVLPSKNEGLPLITVEALKCGANVVGSDVGGISEVIGKENVFPLDTFFVEKVSQRIVDILNFNTTQELSNIFDWARTAEIEYDVYNRIILEERTNQ